MNKSRVSRADKVDAATKQPKISSFFIKLPVRKTSNTQLQTSVNGANPELVPSKINGNEILIKSDDDDTIEIDLNHESKPSRSNEPTTSHLNNQIFATTPDKTYLEQDILHDITQTSNCCDIPLNQKFTPPCENSKKRKYLSDSPDIIPPTPPNILIKAKNKSRMCLESKFTSQNTLVHEPHILKCPKIHKLPGVNWIEIDENSTENSRNIENSPQISSNSAQSTSSFGVVNTKNETPPKTSPHIGQIIETSKFNFTPKRYISSPETKTNPAPNDRNSLEEQQCGFEDDFPSVIDYNSEAEDSNHTISNKLSGENILNDLNTNHTTAIKDQISSLNTKTWTYCKIMEIEKMARGNLHVKLECLDTNSESSCLIQEQWAHTKIKPGDTVNIKAVKIAGPIPYAINKDAGFLVFEPDYMISPTTIVGANFCRRRGILAERFRGIDAENKVMLIGILVHQLLQDVLKLEIYELPLIEKRLIEILATPEIMTKSYTCNISIDELRKDLLPFVAKIHGFVQKFLKGRNIAKQGFKGSVLKYGKSLHEEWKGEIDTIEDIEENVWCPQLGMKGKIDVTLKTKPFGATLPLELKSGRASMSDDHRGQLIIYAMILTELGFDVNSGLLLYIREEIINEVTANHMQKRDLIMLRNEIAYYLTQVPQSTPINDPTGQSKNSKSSEPIQQTIDILTPAELPDPISYYNVCAKCPYVTICTTYASQDTSMQLSENHPIKELGTTLLNHLHTSHIDYFLRWTSLTIIESHYKAPSKQIQDIWRLKPHLREKQGRSLCYLKISKIIPETSDTYVHTFVRALDNNTIDLLRTNGLQSDLLQSGLTTGAYVVISTSARLAVATGSIREINTQEVLVALERNLNNRYKNKTFHLDTYESRQMITFAMTNLAALLDKNDRATRLRELIIDKQRPVIDTDLPRYVKTNGELYLSNLNLLQQRAVLCALSTTDYMRIKGLPGTGKTKTVVALVQMLVAEGKSVLITSHTHSAVDNVCTRLRKAGVDLLRLGADTKVDPSLKDCTDSALTAHCKTPEELADVYNNAKIVAVTCLGTGHSMFRHRTLDVCVVDESTQVLQSTLIKALLVTKAFILIGDPEQLPPIVRNPEALRRGMNESLFDRLYHPEATCTLSIQYRMNKIIMNLANIVSYNGELVSGGPLTDHATLSLPNIQNFQALYSSEQWLTDVLSNEIQNSVYALNTGPTWRSVKTGDTEPENCLENEERKMSNTKEVAIVLSLLEACRQAGVPADTIGVIAPYRCQVALLKRYVSELSDMYKHEAVEVNTVDQYQGRDKNIIIYTCTKSRDTSNTINITGFEILEDKRRLTVAITRAKHKLIIIGDFCTLRDYAPFKKLINSLEEHQCMNLKDDVNGFNWTKVLERLKI